MADGATDGVVDGAVVGVDNGVVGFLSSCEPLKYFQRPLPLPQDFRALVFPSFLEVKLHHRGELLAFFSSQT
jgi:hypothetical protein